MKITTFLFFALSIYLISSEAAVIDGRLSGLLLYLATVSARVNLITSNPIAGSPLQVDCVAKGPPGAKVTWQFGYDQIIADERKRILSNHTLFITKADVSDSGEYRCTVRYNNNVATGSVYVRVKALSTNLISSKAVIDGWKSATVSARVNLVTSNPSAGSPLQVDCVAKGPPGAKMTWQFGDDQINADERRRILSNHTLFIDKADVSDSGEYRCTVRFNNNVATGSVYVRVKDQRRAELSSSDTHQADNKKFKCPLPFGAFSDPDSCEYYHVCVAGVSVRKKCRMFQHFDILRRTCLPMFVAICGNKNKTSTTGTTNTATATTPSGDHFSCPSWTGNFPHPSDCSKYYSCIFYQANLKTCPKSELFDAVKKSCKSAAKVHCGERTRPDSTTTSTTSDIVTKSVTPTETITTETPTETDAIITSSPDDITVTAPKPSSPDSTPTEDKPTGPPETDCDDDDVDCIIDKTGDPDDWFTCPKDIGAYAHPSSNKLFIFCMNWIPSVRKCGMDLTFSKELSTCIEIKYIL